jgi:predicted Holliday junction resolvase-like endonuclease
LKEEKENVRMSRDEFFIKWCRSRIKKRIISEERRNSLEELLANEEIMFGWDTRIKKERWLAVVKLKRVLLGRVVEIQENMMNGKDNSSLQVLMKSPVTIGLSGEHSR